jgi:hypothetical protein
MTRSWSMTKSRDESQKNIEQSAPEIRAEVVPASASDSGGRLLTRTETARRLGISESTLRRREAGGAIKPTVVQGRTAMYEETRVSTVMQTQTVRRRWGAPEVTDGATAARAFELLAQDLGLRNIVRRLELAPEIVAKLARQWAELGAGFFVAADEATELRVGNVSDIRDTLTKARKTVADLFARMEATSGDCQVCGEAGSGVCVPCYKDAKQRADGHALTGAEIRMEQRSLPDGTQEVRLVVEQCDLQNRQVRRGAGWPTLRTEWDNPAEQQFHWARIFSDEYSGPLTPPVPR